MENDEALLPARKVQLRYDIAERTLDRWIAVPEMNFLCPVVIRSSPVF